MSSGLRRAMPLVAVCAFLVVPASASAGLSDASASPGEASGAAVDYPGLVTLNKSETHKDGSAKATGLAVGGMDIIAHENGSYTGSLGAVGAAVDPINTALCEGGALDPVGGYCIVVLHLDSRGASDPELGSISSANAVLLGINGPNNGYNVAGSAAGSQYNAFTGNCSDVSAGYLLISKKQFSAPGTPNTAMHRRAGSIAQPCETPAS